MERLKKMFEKKMISRSAHLSQNSLWQVFINKHLQPNQMKLETTNV
jgi:hypothetical protein